MGKYAISTKTLSLPDGEFADFLYQKNPETQARYTRERARYQRDNQIAPAKTIETRPRPGRHYAEDTTLRYTIVFQVVSSNRRTIKRSYHTVQKSKPGVTDADFREVSNAVAYEYNTKVNSIKVIQTIDNLTGTRVRFS